MGSARGLDDLDENGENKRRVLYVDAYDSFANNVIDLLETTLNVEVSVIKIDASISKASLGSLLKPFDAVVLGPGPGSPNNDNDVGLMRSIVQYEGDYEVPILGICLGFQILGHEFGASVEELNSPYHGIVSKLSTNDTSIFRGLDSVQVVRYHSLKVDLQASKAFSSTRPSLYYCPTDACPDLIPLAWARDPHNGDVLMALKHRSRLLYGLQYHPESICSCDESKFVVLNWWTEAQAWMKQRRRHVRTSFSFPSTDSLDNLPISSRNSNQAHTPREAKEISRFSRRTRVVQTKTERFMGRLPNNKYPTLGLCEALGLHGKDFVLLDSQTLQNGTGRFSIIGLVDANTLRIEYYAHERRLVYFSADRDLSQHQSEICLEPEENAWNHIGSFRKKNIATEGDAQSPFWGGLIGYVSYEAGLSTIDTLPNASEASSTRPDISFVFVERSIVLDHKDCIYYVQSLVRDDWSWISSTASILRSKHLETSPRQDASSPPPINGVTTGFPRQALNAYLEKAEIIYPEKRNYLQKVQDCQKEIKKGYSYELCATDQTRVSIPRSGNEFTSWLLYRDLCERNAAPFAAYLRIGNATVLSSSPERFLHWDREHNFQLRPIKGTVRKTEEVNTLEKATKLLNIPKEIAENLMIVDLTRHDLFGMLGSGRVTVPKLMVVEEYASVFQLISVIEGKASLPKESRFQKHESSVRAELSNRPHHNSEVEGADVLASCLPPGSMTGAPKKASCEILQRVEGHKARGVYSGVLGYMCAGGGGSFSVVIRTAFKWADEGQASAESDENRENRDVWYIGAGGAITSLSDPEAEYAEMRTKLDSVLPIFTPRTFDH